MQKARGYPVAAGPSQVVTYNPRVHDEVISITLLLFYQLTGKALVLANSSK